jgi:hypothetical protein
MGPKYKSRSDIDNSLECQVKRCYYTAGQKDLDENATLYICNTPEYIELYFTFSPHIGWLVIDCIYECIFAHHPFF